MNVTFPKSEKLCSDIAIDTLYKTGKKFVAWPMRVTYLPITDAPTQVLIWAPKSLFKHAVDRNHMRRLMREAYRLNKHILCTENKYYHLAFNYIDKQTQDFHVIEKAMKKALQRLATLEE
ncbi:MAG: ribonuclease P protein component [Paludibacteraceae bacterium]|nr:ribonuclease P protein component [Paludibacteraceae bacterium]MBR5442794.1 ribonuclease P protein component [Paludibacteraceae bacterium]